METSKTIKAARELGKAIQSDPRYVEYHAAKEINDADSPLQELIGEFNLIRQQLGQQASKRDDDDSRDQNKIEELNEKAQEVYARIMENDSMKRFTEAKYDMDALTKEIGVIISLCCDGEDPETCQAVNDCSGGCSSCSKCG
jgi:cell fate (sporulation/competence/biofilm development) regulator YlbF (YheA/YmcA/DUF963 family)